MKKVESKEDYEALNALPQAILFVDALWSGVARRSRIIVERWEEAELTAYGFEVFLADCDAEAHLAWVGARQPLLDETLRHKLTVGGYGTVVWMRHGNIIGNTPGNLHNAMVPELSAKTQELFGLNN